MRIAIDCSKAVNEKAGVSRYTWQIASNLARLYPDDRFFFYFNFLRGRVEKKELIKKLLGKKKNINYKIYPLPGDLKERLFFSPFSILNLWLKDQDIYHAPDFLSFDQGLKIPQILTVHDLTMVKFPEHLGEARAGRYSQMLKKACQNTSAIISVSEATKKDIIEYFAISEEKIRVIYQGSDPLFHKISPPEVREFLQKKYRISFPFILFVGTIEPRKNVRNLLRAFDKFSKQNQGKNYWLLLVGRKGWNIVEIEKTYQEISSRKKVIFLDFVPDRDLLYFYNGAELFCYPSLYEGFGFPVLEAMACGCPVLTSNISSLPEVGGEAAYYLNPYNIAEMAEKIDKTLRETGLRRKMIKRGLEQVKKFSWEKCARETHKVYEEVYNKNLRAGHNSTSID